MHYSAFSWLGKFNVSTDSICAVGHRTVHGGDRYSSSVLIDENVIDTMKELIAIAPLPNPPISRQ
jgi:acetate kinase